MCFEFFDLTKEERAAARRGGPPVVITQELGAQSRWVGDLHVIRDYTGCALLTCPCYYVPPRTGLRYLHPFALVHGPQLRYRLRRGLSVEGNRSLAPLRGCDAEGPAVVQLCLFLSIK